MWFGTYKGSVPSDTLMYIATAVPVGHGRVALAADAAVGIKRNDNDNRF